jgi:hypothetical protein
MPILRPPEKNAIKMQCGALYRFIDLINIAETFSAKK